MFRKLANMFGKLAKPIAAEPALGKAAIVLAIVAVIGHWLPWKTGTSGDVTFQGNGFDITQYGVPSAVLLGAAVGVFLFVLYAQMSARSKKVLRGAALLFVAAALGFQGALYFTMGKQRLPVRIFNQEVVADFDMLAQWGLYVTSALTVLACLLGLLRMFEAGDPPNQPLQQTAAASRLYYGDATW